MRTFGPRRHLLGVALMTVAALGCTLAASAPAVAAAPATSPPGVASGPLVTVPVGTPPLSDAAAAALVQHSGWEPRSQNDADNQRVPSASQLAAFYAQNDEPYSQYVTGDYRGTTDEIIQWAAAKWGLSPDLLRAVASVETWWDMPFVGDQGASFGLFQVREPYNCQSTEVCGLFRHDTSFNADYYASMIRSYYDGKQTWVNTVSGNGQPYAAGDSWGAIGIWYSGRWHDSGADTYIAEVQSNLAQRVWAQPDFVGR